MSDSVNGFEEGFLSFYDSGEFSDIELILDNKTFKAHKILISAQSVFLRKLLTSDFTEVKQSKVNLPVTSKRQRYFVLSLFIFSTFD
jgi:hypothetical protein